MQYLQRSSKQEVLQLQRNWQICYTLCGVKRPPLKQSRMQQLSTYSNGKGILKSVTIIGTSLYYQLLGRSLQESQWTDWMNTLNSQGFYQKANVDSGRTEEQLTWSSQQDSFKRNARNIMWTSTWPLLILPKHLTQSVGRERLWKIMAKLDCPAKFIAMVRQFHDGMLARVQNDGELSDPFYVTNGVKQGCLLASTVFQHDVFCHVHRCFLGWWQWYTY